jgi:hypothetical protein
LQRHPNKPDPGTSQIDALAQILRKLARIWLVIFRPLADPAVIDNISGSVKYRLSIGRALRAASSD